MLPCVMLPLLWAGFLDQRGALVLYPGHLVSISTLCHTAVSMFHITQIDTWYTYSKLNQIETKHVSCFDDEFIVSTKTV